MRNYSKLIFFQAWLVLGIFLISTNSTLGQNEAIRISQFNLGEGNLAVQGYDVVSYFMGAPTKGKKNLEYKLDGVVYWFTNTENLELFKKQPDKFEPAYGGWCAYAMGETKEKIKIDPKTFKIIDGRNYLFYNFYFNNTLIDWNEDEKGLKMKADSAWESFIK